ncbi:NTP pyrophosphatase, house-cleaning of non-canonical NTPs [Geodermatophilus obscurus]|uniref:NTP pyrophosphatase, house-cleaning of non-canonical NTPs n=1 Tax=Geodermatophilus obscurus TaxID=1861 RepID=A0A1I5IBE5_9ACTN|nr:nucleotide pyrophosphohydrolase [Geodermatophilus obscurus]SFO57874.1 NTP pyrophosphatase, house-cleaning of non-canonical NTPs [Geodermatophilus obscurus]
MLSVVTVEASRRHEPDSGVPYTDHVDHNDSLRTLADEARDFSAARDWEQFHQPRNLVLALVGEVGELAAELQWVPDSDVDAHLAAGDRRAAFEDELADVVIYTLRLADVTDVDLASAVRRKLARNAERYPETLSRGRAEKHDRLRG